jgi:hypothetical protein
MKTICVWDEELSYEEAQKRFSDFTLAWRSPFENILLKTTVSMIHTHFAGYEDAYFFPYRHCFPCLVTTASYGFVIDLVDECVYRLPKTERFVAYVVDMWSWKIFENQKKRERIEHMQLQL